ncbi:Lactate dehydrogenase [Palleronia marisminoris]|uniref:Glycerate dehydrogenase n=1 Tax=Palleronia marisminoris TaxID=315423 RepID=A0A1Y5SRN5_9RHOB|nr:2-hydroxyacid dehydrogenase [Palleronia marisminoris]SFG92954.1 Lactate dehydrogenase [Palleronia marisminoris]SLN44989.1 Glycerate dehydrogenase [Palleronia marisminoris]
MRKIAILRAAELSDRTNAELEAAFEVHDLPYEKSAADALFNDVGPRLRGMALRKALVDAKLLDRLPALEIISSYSAGLENVDLAAATARGIEVANTSHVLAGEVANLALGQILVVTRDIRNADKFVRGGHWPHGAYPLQVSLQGMNVGIVGFGQIGQALGARLQAVGANVHYSGPRRKAVDFPYHENPRTLARECRVIVLTCPLTPDTYGLADKQFLKAIGPDGWIVNISRGAILDEAALIDALARNAIAGAALDVFAGEPEVPEALRQDDRVLLTPHIGSGTEQTRQAMGDAMVDALVAKLTTETPPRR